MKSEDLRAQLEQHHAASFGWAMGCCRRDRVEAEDVLHTVYLKVLEGKARFNGQSSFKTWLFAVIRKTASDHRRRSLVRSLIMSRATERAPSSPMEHPDDSAYRSEIQQIFQRALGRLSGRQREALELVFYHEMNIEQAAAVMQVSLGSARTHYERGKKRLRELLEESEVAYETEWRRKRNPATVP